MAFDRSTRWLKENTCSARAEDPRSLFFSIRDKYRIRWHAQLRRGRRRS